MSIDYLLEICKFKMVLNIINGKGKKYKIFK